MERRLSIFADRLASHTRLHAEERAILGALTGKVEHLRAHHPIALAGDAAASVTLVLEGLCARVEMPTATKRQITGIYVEGDIPDLYTVFQPETNASMETLTSAVIVRIPHDVIRKVMRSHPALTEAFARQIVFDGAVTAEWLTNVGAREGRWCLAHLFCEMAVRLGRVVGNSFSFAFPVCQEKLGEACGLSAVHVNRSLMALRDSGLMHMKGGGVHVRDWKSLTVAANFTGRYLAPREPIRYLH